MNGAGCLTCIIRRGGQKTEQAVGRMMSKARGGGDFNGNREEDGAFLAAASPKGGGQARTGSTDYGQAF